MTAHPSKDLTISLRIFIVLAHLAVATLPLSKTFTGLVSFFLYKERTYFGGSSVLRVVEKMTC